MAKYYNLTDGGSKERSYKNINNSVKILKNKIKPLIMAKAAIVLGTFCGIIMNQTDFLKIKIKLIIMAQYNNAEINL